MGAPLIFTKNVHYDAWYNDPRMLRYFFSILLIALLVSIFEMAFVYFVSIGTTEKAVNGFFPPVPDQPLFQQIQATERSDRLDKNFYITMNYGIVIVFMMWLLYVIYVKMEFQNQVSPNVFGPNFRATILQCIFSVVVIAAFQLSFYEFAKKTIMITDPELYLATARGALQSIEERLREL